jgi:hypothetical protein
MLVLKTKVIVLTTDTGETMRVHRLSNGRFGIEANKKHVKVQKEKKIC